MVGGTIKGFCGALLLPTDEFGLSEKQECKNYMKLAEEVLSSMFNMGEQIQQVQENPK